MKRLLLDWVRRHWDVDLDVADVRVRRDAGQLDLLGLRVRRGDLSVAAARLTFDATVGFRGVAVTAVQGNVHADFRGYTFRGDVRFADRDGRPVASTTDSSARGWLGLRGLVVVPGQLNEDAGIAVELQGYVEARPGSIAFTDGRVEIDAEAGIALVSVRRDSGTTVAHLRSKAVPLRILHALGSGIASLAKLALPGEGTLDCDVRYEQGAQASLEGMVDLQSAPLRVCADPLRWSQDLLDGTQLVGMATFGELARRDLVPAAIGEAAQRWELEPTDELRFDVSLSGPGRKPRVDGKLSAERIRFASVEVSPPVHLDVTSFESALTVDRDGMWLRRARAQLLGARLSAELMPRGFAMRVGVPRLSLRAGADRDSLVQLQATLATRWTALHAIAIPAEIRLEAAISQEASGRLAGQALVRAGASGVEVELVRDATGGWAGSSMRANVDLAQLFDRSDLPSGAIGLAAYVRGATEPRWEANLSAARLTVPLPATDGADVHAELTDLEAMFEGVGAWVVLRRAELSVGEGVVHGHGEASGAGGSLHVHVVGVRVGSLPVVSGYADGLLSGTVRWSVHAAAPVAREPGEPWLRDLAAWELDADFALEQPVYTGITRVQPAIDRSGFPALDPRGTETARLHLSKTPGGDLTAELVRASVAAASLDGRVTIAAPWGKNAQLRGDASARVAASYLERRRSIPFPSKVTGDVVVPIRVSGTVTAPAFDVALAQVAARAIVDGPAYGSVRNVLRRIRFAAAQVGETARQQLDRRDDR